MSGIHAILDQLRSVAYDEHEEQGNPRYILGLIARIVTVSVETVKLVNALPALDIIE